MPSNVLRMLRALALIAVAIGGVASLGLLFREARRTPLLLLVLFVGWVALPFVGLAAADIASKRWSVATRAALYSVMLIVTLGSVAVYSTTVLRPLARPAALFLMVPLASWLLIAVVLGTAALLSRRRA